MQASPLVFCLTGVTFQSPVAKLMISNILTRIFGSRNERLLKQYAQVVRQINGLEAAMGALSDDELRGKTALLKGRIAAGETLDAVLPEAFAVVREAASACCRCATSTFS